MQLYLLTKSESKIMKFLETVGIDVSKDTFDAVLHQKQCHRQFKNTTSGFRSFIKWTEQNTRLKIDQIQICFEWRGALA